MLIEEGSKVVIYNLSHDSYGGIVIAGKSFELKENTLIMDNGYLCCTDSITQNNNGLIVIKVYEQDAVIVKNDVLYEKISEAY